MKAKKTLIKTPVLSYYAEDMSIPRKPKEEIHRTPEQKKKEKAYCRMDFYKTLHEYKNEMAEYTPQQLSNINKAIDNHQWVKATWELVKAHTSHGIQ